MRVKIGDIIGTTDGRYGTITSVSGPDWIEVAEANDPNEPCIEEANMFYIALSDVASIV